MKRRRIGIPFLLAVAGWLGSPAVQACAVCFGKTDSPLGKGLHWGVLALLGFVVLMLTAFGAFAVFLARRSVAMESAEFRDAEPEPNPPTGSDASS